MARAYPGSLKAERVELHSDVTVYVVISAHDEVDRLGQRFTLLRRDSTLAQDAFIAAPVGWVHPC